MFRQVALNRARVAQQGEALEDPDQRGTNLVVGIEHDGAVPQPPIADRQAQGQLAAPGFVEQIAPHPGMQDMQFRGKQGAFDAQQQPVIRILRAVHAVLVRNQGAEDGAQFNDAMPVTVAARQA